MSINIPSVPISLPSKTVSSLTLVSTNSATQKVLITDSGSMKTVTYADIITDTFQSINGLSSGSFAIDSNVVIQDNSNNDRKIPLSSIVTGTFQSINGLTATTYAGDSNAVIQDNSNNDRKIPLSAITFYQVAYGAETYRPNSEGSFTVVGSDTAFTQIGTTGWLDGYLSNFTGSTAGVLTYTGTETLIFNINWMCTAEKTGNGSSMVCVQIRKNSTVLPQSEGCTTSTTATSFSGNVIISLSTNDTIDLAVINTESDGDVQVDGSKITINLLK